MRQKGAITDPKHAEQVRRAYRSLSEGRPGDAKLIAEGLLSRKKRDVAALDILGRVAVSNGELEEAAGYFKNCAGIKQREPGFKVSLGRVYSQQGKYREAIAQFERAQRLRPNDPSITACTARALMRDNSFERAREVLEARINTGPISTEIVDALGRVEIHDRRFDVAVELMQSHLEKGLKPSSELRDLYFTLGSALEKAERFDEAFEAYSRANATVPAPFNPEAYIAHIDRFIKVFSTDKIATLPRAQTHSKLAVFIVGMPRSGSTLFEQILASHRHAFGGGEMPLMGRTERRLPDDVGSTLAWPECVSDMNQADTDRISAAYLQTLAALAPSAERIADKALPNFHRLGLIQMLLPGASIINCRRDPLDMCLSCFGERLNHEAPYSSDLRHLGLVYRQYERLMDHWRQVLDLPILDLGYEDMIADQEKHSRRLIEFCGLEWDDACLQFHQSERRAQTLSFDQVRRPIYKTSVSRAAKFHKHLGPLKEALNAGS